MASLLLLDDLLDKFTECDKRIDDIFIDLTVFEYSRLLHDAFTKTINDCNESDDKLMNLCVDMSLWITSPNESIYQYEFNKYFNNLNKYFYRNVSQIITSFIFDPSKYLKWIQFESMNKKKIKNMDLDEFVEFVTKEFFMEIGDNFDNDKCKKVLISNDIDFVEFKKLSKEQFFEIICDMKISTDIVENVYFTLNAKISIEKRSEKEESNEYTKWQNQLTYSYNDSIVNFSKARYDIINIRTDLLSNDTKYFINIYCFHKGDELWLGLVNENGYEPSKYYRTYKHGLFYYGGRESRIRRFGGDIFQRCTAGEWIKHDCNHGGIQGANKVIKHPLNSYSSGDWINFVIDMQNKEMIFYKNGVQEYKLEKKEYFPKGDCYFIVEVDDRFDKFYIEQAIDDSNYC